MRPGRPAPTAGPVRAARVAVLGGLSLLLAAGAHLAGGGSLPGPGVLAVAAALLGLLAAVLTTRRLRFGALLGVLGGEQLALHALFGLAAAAQSCTFADGHLAHTAHTLGHHVETSCSSGGMAMTSTLPGWLMWVAHLAAVALTAWLLARGEDFLWRALDQVAAAAGLCLRRRAPRRGSRDVVAPLRSRLLQRVWLEAAPRGPPVG